jgi:hypothetical protein
VRWNRALRGDSVLDAKTREVFHRAVRDGYACGIFVEVTDRGTTKAHHSGGVAGYRAVLASLLDEDTEIVVLTNDKCEPHAVAKTIEQELFPPAAVSLAIDVTPYELGPAGAAFGAGASFRAERRGDHLALQLVDDEHGHAAATIRLPRERVRALAQQLDRAIEQLPADSVDVVDAGVYLSAYPKGKRHRDLTDGIDVRIMPRYQGRGADGKPVVDHRVTFIVVDDEHHMWPVMVKLGKTAAIALRGLLREAADRR